MHAPEEFPVTVIMEQGVIARAAWSLPHWKLIGVVAAHAEASPSEPRTIQSEGDARRLMWSGLRLRLYPDEADSYWHNLLGRQPSLFVICAADGANRLRPTLVTANYDEAGAHMETDGKVFSAPMPAEIYRWLEGFVITHYRPQATKQRKRKGWKHETFEQTRPRARRA